MSQQFGELILLLGAQCAEQSAFVLQVGGRTPFEHVAAAAGQRDDRSTPVIGIY
jgi:hypothetical protein